MLSYLSIYQTHLLNSTSLILMLSLATGKHTDNTKTTSKYSSANYRTTACTIQFGQRGVESQSYLSKTFCKILLKMNIIVR